MEHDYIFLKMRMFGSKDCETCDMMKKAMKHHGLAYDFIDVDDPKNQKIVDFFDVDEMPLVQVLDNRSNTVIAFHAGWIDPMKFLKKAGSLVSEQKKTGAFNLSQQKKKRRCSDCYDK